MNTLTFRGLSLSRRLLGLGAIACVAMSALALSPAQAMAQAAGQVADAPAQAQTLQELSPKLWAAAKAGLDDQVLTLLERLKTTDVSPEIRTQIDSLKANLSKREETRQKKLQEVGEKFEAQIVKTEPSALSDAVKHSLEMYLLTKPEQRPAFKRQERIQNLIKRAAESAKAAETSGDWFTANELFYRINALMEEEGTYKDDVRRLSQRLSMIRLYSPEHFWKLRNDERLKDNKPALPPYNGLGEDYLDKIEKINRRMVMVAVVNAARQQIDKVDLKTAMLGGIDSLRTMITTSDLKKTFPGIADAAKVQSMQSLLDEWTTRLNAPGMFATANAMEDFLEQATARSRTSVDIPDNAILHEFGNGAMAKMDEFSAIIWPDELPRFERMTSGQFRGIGVSIQIDEESQMIKVVTPIEGTPAQRAGVRMGDLIKKIDGKSAIGISLNQAVDLITGPADSKVTVTMERRDTSKGTDGAAKEITQDIDFNLVRAVIPIVSVKGWSRTGAREDAWDWYIDRDRKVGYIRLVQFTESTTTDLHNAINAMKKDAGLNGLILDLRYNPGGLLTEAVGVANTFINSGTIVSTEGTVPGEVKSASPNNTLVRDVPLIVLINEGSASASEIVSGAIRHYADKGDIQALVLGMRSFGKGSVQNVWPIAANARMKLTTQYYKLPDGRIIHRKPGATVWGVDPHLAMEMLPETASDALKLRQDADVLPLDENGVVVADPAKPRPSPNKLLTDGLDIQLQTALVLLQSRAALGSQQAVVPTKPTRSVE